jgi:hypothetical protein
MRALVGSRICVRAGPRQTYERNTSASPARGTLDLRPVALAEESSRRATRPVRVDAVHRRHVGVVRSRQDAAQVPVACAMRDVRYKPRSGPGDSRIPRNGRHRSVCSSLVGPDGRFGGGGLGGRRWRDNRRVLGIG